MLGAVPGHELADDGANRRQAAGDLGSGQHVGHGVGDAQLAHDLPAAGVVHGEQVQQVGVDRGQAGGGVGDDREERDDEGDGHHPLEAVADPQNDERRDGDDGHGLQEDGVRVQAAGDDSGLGEEQGDEEAGDETQQEPGQGPRTGQ